MVRLLHKYNTFGRKFYLLDTFSYFKIGKTSKVMEILPMKVNYNFNDPEFNYLMILKEFKS